MFGQYRAMSVHRANPTRNIGELRTDRKQPTPGCLPAMRRGLAQPGGASDRYVLLTSKSRGYCALLQSQTGVYTLEGNLSLFMYRHRNYQLTRPAWQCGS